MSIEDVRDGAGQRLETILDRLPGVAAVDLTSYPERVTVRLDEDGARTFVTQAIREKLGAEGLAVPEIEVEVSAAATPRTHRARFESIETRSIGPGRIEARVVLDWRDEPVEGAAEGEASAAGELRACAIATIRAVEKVAAEGVTFTLTGAKELHVFDHDLVAVLLHSPQTPTSRLMGTSIISEDRRRSAALAVLSATNRLVGGSAESQEA